MKNTSYSVIEVLEPRVAPASVLTYTDVDGDLVKIRSSVGNLNAPGVATFDASGHQLQLLTLTDPSFQGASLSTTVTKSAIGDGLVNIGRIDASGRDLGSVVIKGDLGGIFCGDSNRSTTGLELLKVRSMGVYGTATQGGGSGGVSGVVEGRIGAIIVQRDLVDAQIGARSLVDRADGSIGRVVIGGSLLGNTGANAGTIFSTGDMGSVTIGGDVVGTEISSGSITCGGTLHSLTIRGSLIGGSGFLSGNVFVSNLGVVKIGHDMQGGTGAESGSIVTQNNLASLTVGGSIVGGSGAQQFETGVHGVSRLVEGQVLAFGDIGSVKIGGGLIGAGGYATAEIRSLGSIASVVVGGSVAGGGGGASGQIVGESGINSVTIKHGLTGGAGTSSGRIEADATLAKVSIGGSVEGGSGNNSGQIVAFGNLGALQIGGDLRGAGISGSQPTLDGSGYIEGVRIGSVTIGGSVIAGLDESTGGDLVRSGSIRARQDIGSVTVKGSLLGQVGSNLTGGAITPVIISAAGQATPSSTADVAIQKFTVGGSVVQARVLAGYGIDLAPVNGNASIGSVAVGGDWIAGSIAAGVLDGGSPGFGTPGDVVINKADDAILAKIASITIRGVVAGTTAAGDHFGFTAQQIGAFRTNGVAIPLKGGASNDVVELSPTTGDVTVREV